MTKAPPPDSLPYIDAEPTESEKASARALISHELETNPPSSPPLLPPAHEASFSAAITSELERISADKPSTPLPLSRYEAQDAPEGEKGIHVVRPALEASYVSAEYLALRGRNLSLLDSHGVNAWLLHNHHLDSIRDRTERQRRDVAAEVDVVNATRQSLQVAAKAELDALDREWRKTVGRVLETELDVCRLEAEIRRLRRALLQSPSAALPTDSLTNT
ncbi:hypothetical protein L249_1002 [Ophiocordyceps polyrhachis-furcata BCC 54312]|uniref:Pre-mRNA-splicing factor SPF27 n=1 Tax=Ophiocordyceps polyrhachis-furcata BCC 54312 TaxID=1330021 RepID=A0A367LE38_9HYPO|nr:hypothetical protein L249_1002 [Ophiocordyceps polyrhachis-furcata BCC 54312]